MSCDSLGEIWMKGEFNQTTAFELRKQILEYVKLGPDVPVIIYINSYGGQVDALNSILDTLDSIPNKVITVCAGTAMSAGAVLLAYGDERYIGRNSRVMVHQISSGTYGTVHEIKESTKEMTRMNHAFAKVIAKKTGQSLKKIKEIFRENTDKYFNATESVKFGLADQIGMPRLVEKTVTVYAVVE